jgi:uncharacterized membrane protein YgaE (UPF0421/DUF939 family)
VIANSVFHSPEAFLAPYAALFIIGNTVRNSMRVAARQVSVVILGVVVARSRLGSSWFENAIKMCLIR